MKKNRIFVDISILNEFRGNLTGISRTIYNLTRYMVLEHSDEFDTQFFCFSKDRPEHAILSRENFLEIIRKIYPEDAAAISEKLNNRAEATSFSKGDLILLLGEQWLYPDAFKQIDRIKQSSGTKVASIIYDIVPFFSPQFYWDDFPEKFKLAAIAGMKVSDFLFVISECTERDVLRVSRELNLRITSKIQKIRLGDNFFTPEMISAAAKPTEENFVLSVGTIQPRKNHTLLLYAWKILVQKLGKKTPKLVILGNEGWHINDFMHFCKNDPELESRIVFKTNASDFELISYYKNALFTLFPAFYEGWGLPVAESASLAKFCISSNTSSMPEIAGDLIDYHSPYDSGELARLILRYVENPTELESRAANLMQKYKKTTWGETTSEMLATIRSWKSES